MPTTGPSMFFTTQQVQRLAGVSLRMLRYWEQTGVFSASYVDERARVPYRRIYTFRDLVSLRTLAVLRRKHRVNLDELRKAGQFLRQRYDAPWAELTFGVVGRHVVFREPGTQEWITPGPKGQQVIPFVVEHIARAVEQEAARLRERSRDEIGQIVRHRHVVGNAWVVAGTRIPTSAIWHFHEDGYGTQEIIAAYPRLTPRDVDAAIAHEQRLRSDKAA